MSISKHFPLDELMKSQTALRLGLDNTPVAEELEALAQLCEKVLEPIREHYGLPVVVSSGYRSPAVNKAIGSKSYAGHENRRQTLRIDKSGVKRETFSGDNGLPSLAA